MATPTIVTPKQLAQAAITASYVTIYTVPGGTKTAVQTADLANTAGILVSVYLHFVPSGGAVGAANAVIYNVDIPAKGVLSYTGPAILEAGGFISVKGSDVGVTITVSGLETS